MVWCARRAPAASTFRRWNGPFDAGMPLCSRFVGRDARRAGASSGSWRHAGTAASVSVILLTSECLLGERRRAFENQMRQVAKNLADVLFRSSLGPHHQRDDGLTGDERMALCIGKRITLPAASSRPWRRGSERRHAAAASSRRFSDERAVPSLPPNR